FQAEDGIRDPLVTGVQTCALPIYYADQRYYAVSTGRFSTPDPSGQRSASPASPASWNTYSYVQSDPVNFRDSKGLVRSALDEDRSEERRVGKECRYQWWRYSSKEK